MPTQQWQQEKIAAIQAQTDLQNQAKARANLANVYGKVDANSQLNNQIQQQGVPQQAKMAYNPSTATPWQKIAAQNLQNNGIDPTKLGTGVGENYQPYNPNATGNATIQPMPGSASSILGEWFGAEDPFITQYNQDQLNAYNEKIDPQAEYDNQVKMRQAQIDAANAMYRDQLNQARIRGQWRIGSGTAMQARGGLLGSDFWAAQTNAIQDTNTQVENSIENERLVAVNQILSEAQKDATAEIAAKRAAKEAGGAAYLQYLSGASERKSAKTSKAAQLLLSLGKSPQDISDAELKQAGISRQDLTMEYTAGKSSQEAAQATAKAEQEKAALEALKTQSEIDKNQAAIITEALKTGRVYESGWFIFDGATNQVIGNAQAVTRARASGGGGGGSYSGWGGVLAGYINPTGRTSLDLQQVELPWKATEFSKKSYGFGTRMAESEDSIAAIENLYKTTGTSKEFLTNILPSFLQSAEMQKFNQAKRNFVNAVLRNESGAVISPSEFDNADKQYFPQPWDTPEVLAQKAKNRDLVTSNMFASAGKDAKGNNIKDIYNVVKQQNTQTQPSNTTTPTWDAYEAYLKSIQ